jgi:putative glutamine amidotransferase
MAKPVIGITSDLDIGISQQSISPGRCYYILNKNYVIAIEKSGGAPLVLPCISEEETIELYLEKIQGLVISGGLDLDPIYYGEEPLPTLGAINPERANFEIMLAKRALNRDIPILAICGGCQLLNVVAGGTLYQDINSQVSDVLNHRQRAPRWYPFHTVKIHRDTKLYQILKEEKIRVNSRHHQAIKKLGKDFIVSGEAEDGIIEAIENPNLKFCIGVQWHPEDMFEKDYHSQTLFKTFIKSCE